MNLIEHPPGLVRTLHLTESLIPQQFKKELNVETAKVQSIQKLSILYYVIIIPEVTCYMKRNNHIRHNA